MNLEDDQDRESSVSTRNHPGKSQMERHMPQMLNDDFEMFPHATITVEGDLVKVALFSETELVSFEQALHVSNWVATMEEE